jgi:WD40 repeat protein
MNKTIVTILIFVSVQSSLFCMKRQRDQSLQTNKRPSKKRKIIGSLHLHNFFAITTKLQNACDKRHKNVPELSKKAKNLVTQFPRDIKNIIATKTTRFNDNSEWWYTNNKREYNSRIYSVSFNPTDDSELAIGFAKGYIKIINPYTYEPFSKDVVTARGASACTYNNKGTALAYGLRDGTIRIITPRTHENQFSCAIDTSASVWALSFNDNDEELAIGLDSTKNNVKVINIKTKKTICDQQISKTVYGISLQNNILIYGLANGKLNTINMATQKDDAIFQKDPWLLSLSCNQNICAIGSSQNSIEFIDLLAKKAFFAFYTLSNIYALSYGHDGKQLAVGLENGTLLILQKYQPSPRQRLLRKILFLWTQVEKPNKNIIKPAQLLATIINKFNLNKTEVTTTWETFPPGLQTYLWNRISSIIQKRGK